ncbi:MAG: molybdopterin molybdotransferase MoeA [Deltaproteobacteria bacterium]|jgi:molybdopterin molybdotransferase|nr:molybdopterin molybdotransferase MoeA [Deltaproteobacteria bacterium]
MNSPAPKSRDMLGRTDTVSLKEALRLLRQHLPACPAETITLEITEALGWICAENVLSPENLPPYPRSTMDGFAVSAADTFGASENLPAYLEVTGDVPMGQFPEHGPGPGACYHIATGGILPPGTDAVVMLEHTVAVDEQMIEVMQPVASGANVIGTGEDIIENEILLHRGHRIRPQDIGLLAGVGLEMIVVFRRVRVGIISTGDEIVPHDRVPPPGKIRDMNSVALAGMVRENNGRPTFYGIAADNEQSLTAMMLEAKSANDIVLLSGSSSVGARDIGEKVLEKLGQPGIIFHGVAIKPGKPVIMASADDTLLFGLPGHPVSAAVAFNLFVRPAIISLSGVTDDGLPQYPTIKAKLMRNINSASGRTDYVRVQIIINDNALPEAHPILGKSGALSTMVKAHGIIEIEEKIQGIKEGETVEVELFD